MSKSPDFKIYRNGEYVGCTKYAEDAAALVSVSGGEMRYRHRLGVWREGAEPFPAGESYDRAAEWMTYRVKSKFEAGYIKVYGALWDGYTPAQAPDGYPQAAE
jgi:hypothetical protein